MNTTAVDFETYYDSGISVKPLGAHGYFDALTLEQIYLVSIVHQDGTIFVGHPKDADWSFMATNTILVWNGGFEIQGFRRLRELGIDIPEPHKLMDVADMACYFGLPRALKNATREALGIIIEKGIRDVEMKGKEWVDMDTELRARVVEYAINDSRYTLDIWNKYQDKWTEDERLISKLSRDWAAKGIGADTDVMDKAIQTLKLSAWEALKLIPWYEPDNPKCVILSPKKLGMLCRENNIPCPSSLAIDNEECAEWEDTYGEVYPWVGAMRDYRRTNILIKKVESMKRRVFDNRLCYEIKYFGAGITGRWSGSSGVNMQNISGKTLYGVNCRTLLVAPSRKVFVVADLAQIEPRIILWMVGDEDQLSIIASGKSPYIAHAMATMGLKPGEEIDKSSKLYKLAKFRTLGLGYGCGHHKFIDIAKKQDMVGLFDDQPQEQFVEAYVNYLADIGNKEWIGLYKNGDDKTKTRLVNSWQIVQDYRIKSPKIVGFWDLFKKQLSECAARAEDLVIELPSGREIVYRKCRHRRVMKEGKQSSEVVADINRAGERITTRLYGGLVAENVIQGTARCAFRDCMLRLHEEGYSVALHVHDEVVIEVPKRNAEFHSHNINRIMSMTPTWAPGLPIGTEAKIAKTYAEGK